MVCQTLRLIKFGLCSRSREVGAVFECSRENQHEALGRCFEGTGNGHAAIRKSHVWRRLADTQVRLEILMISHSST